MRMCRICRDTECLNMVLISENNGILSLYEYCFGLSVTIQDEPRLLCKQCAENVKKYATFKDKCLKSDMYWKSVPTKVCDDEKVLPNYVKTENIDLLNTNDECSQNSHESIDTSNERSCFIFNDEDKNYNPIKVEDPINLNLDKLEKDANHLNKIVKRVTNVKPCPKRKVKIGFKCKTCKKKYGKEKLYLSHIKTCSLIKRKSTNLGTNSLVKTIVPPAGKAAFNKTSVTDSEQQILRESEKINNNEDKNRPNNYCGLCKLTFTNHKASCTHLDEHWRSEELGCKLCDFIGADPAAFLAHRFTHNPTKVKPRYMCHICLGVKKSPMALQFHYRSEHLKKSGGLCSKCNKEFPSFASWRRHEKSHNVTPNFICDICGKRFRFKYQIREHVMDHLDLNKYICHECGKIFRRSKYLKLHMNGVHAKLGPIKCSHCDGMFKSKQTLMVHLSVVQRKKKLKCEYCFKEFPSACYLKDHMVMHSDERPYSCHICGLSYKAKSQLKVHMRKHSGFMPHKCELCTKSFATINQLKRHATFHTGLRPHKCSQCDRTFHYKKLLMKHCASHHKMEANKE